LYALSVFKPFATTEPPREIIELPRVGHPQNTGDRAVELRGTELLTPRGEDTTLAVASVAIANGIVGRGFNTAYQRVGECGDSEGGKRREGDDADFLATRTNTTRVLGQENQREPVKTADEKTSYRSNHLR